MFKGILIDKDEAGYHVNLTDIDEARLPSGDVTIDVSHNGRRQSTLSAAIHWPTCAPVFVIGVWRRPVAWRRAWSFRGRLRRSFCAVSRWRVSTA